ncbi:MAG: hypothetical protein IJ220_06680 [Clostridia bacterium]|nr:hypothetical protein [Clostridia bacterium]
MENKLSKIEDVFSYYSSDKVNCFERQIANALEFYHENFGKVYLILNKIRDTYVVYNKNFRNINLFEIIGVEIKHESCDFCNLINSVIKKIDMNEIVLLEGDLKNLFYSNYYMNSSWPHLLLIEGYDTEKNLLYVFDNAQFSDLDLMYDHFKLTYSLLQDFSTKKEFCRIISINKLENFNKNSLSEIILKLTDILITSIKNYNNIIVFEIENKRQIDNNYLINIPKFMEVLYNEYFNIVHSILNKCNLKEDMNFIKYINLWKKIVNRNILSYLRNKSIAGISEEEKKEIKDFESVIVLELCLVKKRLTNIKPVLPLFHEDKYLIENDNDHIIETDDKNIYFHFCKNKSYNMWLEDSAPKCVLHKGKLKDFIISIKIVIDRAYTVESFQTGIYFKLDNRIYFAAIDNSNLIVLDEIGVDNLSYNKEVSYKHTLLVEYKNSILSVRIDDDTYILSRYISGTDMEIGELGVACKTWGKPGTLKINCLIKQLDLNKGT